MKNIISFTVLFPIIFFMNKTANASPSGTIDIETGILFPTNNSSIRSSAAALGYLKGDSLEILSGLNKNINSYPANTKKTINVLSSYSYGSGLYGLGFSGDYIADNFINSFAAGFDARYILLGVNAKFNATTWTKDGFLSILSPNKFNGFVIGATFSDFWTATSSFSGATSFFNLGLGYYKPSTYYLEVNTPISFSYSRMSDTIQNLHPSFSFSYIGVTKLNLNIGVSGMSVNIPNISGGTMHAGLFYWLTDSFGMGGYYNKYNMDYSFSLRGNF